MKSITRFTRNTRGNTCLNCEREISVEDNFCPHCGQVNDLKKISLKQYLSAYFDDFLSFDSRLLNTVVALIFKPGYVTKNYVEGRRMAYINPFRLYINITILFFLLVGIFSTIDKYKPIAENSVDIVETLNKENTKAIIDSVKTATLKELQNPDFPIDSVGRAAIEKGIMTVGSKIDSFSSDNPEKLNLRMQVFVDSLSADPSNLSVFIDTLSTKKEKDSVMRILMETINDEAATWVFTEENVVIKDWGKLDTTFDHLNQKTALKKVAAKHFEEILLEKGVSYQVPESIIDSDSAAVMGGLTEVFFNKTKIFMNYDKEHPNATAQEALDDLGYEKSYWNVFSYSKAQDWNEAFEDSEYLRSLADRILSRVSVALFFLLPIFTLIVSLLYIRNKYNYTEHLVFVFHIQTVFFIFLMLFVVLGRAVHSDAVPWIFLIIFMIYLYKAMKYFYGQGWFKTIVKYIILNFSFLFLALLGGLVISFLAFFV